MNCIDVSEFQGVIDWNKVKNDGVDAVVIRAGYGKGNTDGMFHDNIINASAAGLHIGIYWFSYAYNDDMAVKEAEYCNDLIKDFKESIDMPVFFDWEYDSMKYAKKNGVYPDKGLISTMTRAFCEAIEKLGYTAGYYLNLDYANNYYNEEILAPYKRWFARYIKTEQKDCYLWQNSDKGSVDGIKGNVDTDVLWGELTPCNKDSVNNAPVNEKPQETADSGAKQPIYKVGNVYTVHVNSALNVRTGAGVGYDPVGYYNLTPDGRAHANRFGALLPNTRVTCIDVERNDDGSIWVRIPSGWVCACTADGTQYLI